MRVSIAITSYNYERYLEAAIESALGQTYRDVEVVVVDDGSTDGSPAIMRRFADRARLLFKQNGGQGSAFNAAFEATTGDAVLFLDSDDVLHPEAVAKAVAAWRPGCAKVHFPLRIIDEHGRPTGGLVPRAPLREGALEQDLLTSGMYVSPPNSGNLFARGFLEQVMPMPERDWVYGPDCYLVFLAPFFGAVGALREPMAFYRRHSQSVTNITTASAADMVAKLLDMLENDRRLRSLLERFTIDRGLALSPGAVTSHWLHLKLRLALLKLGSSASPDDAAFALSMRLLQAVWSAPDLDLRGRFGFTAWAVLTASMPVRAALPLVRLAYAPGDRMAVVRAMMGAA